MAAASRKAELPSHAEFQASHVARVASINEVHSNEIEEAEKAKTRAHVNKAKTLKVVSAEHQASRLERNAAVVQDSIALFRTSWANFVSTRELGKAEVVGKHFRNREAETLRVLGRQLTDELAIAVCEEFAARHPHTDARARFANYADNWIRMFESGIAFFAQRAALALRNQFDIQAQQSALLQLEAAVARIGAAPGYFGCPTEDVDALWSITASCLPGDIDEQRRQAHVAAVKARNIAAHVENSAVTLAAARGDATARAAVDARGPGFLDALLRNAKSIVKMAGLHEREAAL